MMVTVSLTSKGPQPGVNIVPVLGMGLVDKLARRTAAVPAIGAMRCTAPLQCTALVFGIGT